MSVVNFKDKKTWSLANMNISVFDYQLSIIDISIEGMGYTLTVKSMNGDSFNVSFDESTTVAVLVKQVALKVGIT